MTVACLVVGFLEGVSHSCSEGEQWRSKKHMSRRQRSFCVFSGIYVLRDNYAIRSVSGGTSHSKSRS
jgi:hypothetical protein